MDCYGLSSREKYLRERDAINARYKSRRNSILILTLVAICGIIITVLSGYYCYQNAYQDGFRDGQIEVLNYLSQNGYEPYEVAEDGTPHYTALGKKSIQILTEIINDLDLDLEP